MTRIRESNIFMGFVHLKSLEQKIGQEIPRERARHGPFIDLDNFLHRIPMGLEQANILIRIGAFRFTGTPKRNLLWKARLILGQEKIVQPTKNIFEIPVKGV